MRKFFSFATSLIIIGLLTFFIGCAEEEKASEMEIASAAYVVNGAAQTISVFDIEKSAFLSDVSIPSGKWPADIKIRGDFAYVVNTGDNNVQIIDLASNTTAGMIDIGDGTAPEKIAFASDTKAYVSSNWTQSVKVVDLSSKTVVKSINVGVAPWGVAFANGKVYVCNTGVVYGDVTTYGQGTVSVIDTATDNVLKTINVETNPTDVVADSNGNVLVLCTGNYADITGKIVVIDSQTDSAGAPVDLSTTPSGITITKNGIAYITFFGGLLSFDIAAAGALLHDASSALTDFAGGAGLAADAAGNVYITVPDWTGGGKDKLLVMDVSEKLIGTYPAGGGASMVAIKP
ncbi:YncE family protein [Candidatus Poribacteria bacterium]|nr:YncE family protein [Candidatus Poribacteria bacterium]